MNFDFELVLFYAILVTGVIVLFDVLFLAKKRKKTNKKTNKKTLPLVIDYARSFFPILIIVFLLRSFLYEGFRIPSGSLEPTLLVGDFIIVNKYEYGVRLPVIHRKIMDRHEPKRGDIFVFRWPADPSTYFIKRIVGIPGDHISYLDKVLYVNGIKAAQIYQNDAIDFDETGNEWKVSQYQEDLLGVKHSIYLNADKKRDDFRDIVVPQGMYFAMGDNRDDSADSRYWGFVPDKNIVGKAVSIFISWNSRGSWSTPWDKIRWNRVFSSIKNHE